MKTLLIFLALGLCFTLYAVSGRKSKKEEWEKLKKWDYAHRGLHHDDIPENTLRAYKEAIEHGYGFEFDIQRTKDDVLVVMHDFSLLRACNIDKNIDECTYEEIKDLTVFNQSDRIPLFTEVLDLVSGQIPLIIEIKMNSNNTRVCELVAEVLDQYKGAYCVESFNPVAVKWFKDHRPDWIRGQLSTSYNKNRKNPWIINYLLSNVLTNVLTRPDFVAYNVNDLDKHWGFKFYRDLIKGFTVLWTVRDQNTYTACKAKYDIQIFENFIPKH